MAGDPSEQPNASSRVRAYRLDPDPALKTPFAPVVLGYGTSTVGRVASCEVRLEGDLVSRRHAKLEVTDEGLMVHDLDSHNGVFVNGKKVRSGPAGPGDKIYFGNVCAHVTEVESDRPLPSLTESSLMQRAASDADPNGPSAKAFRTLCAVTDLLLTESDEVFFNEVMRHLNDLCGAGVCAIFRPRGDKLDPIHVAFGPSETRKEVPQLRDVLQRVMRERVVLYTKGDGSDPALEDQALGSALLVPLLSGEMAIGVLFVGRRESNGFSERVVETASAISHLISIRLTGLVLGQDGDQTAVRVGADTAEGAPAIVDQLRSDLAAAQESAQTAAAASDALRAERDGFAAEVEQLKKAVQEASAGGETKAALEQLQEQLADAEADRKEISEALEATRQQLQQVRDESASAAAAAAADGEAARNALRAEADAFRERAALAEKEISHQQERRAELEAEKAEADEEIAHAREQLQQLHKLQEKYTEMQNDLAAAAVERLNLQDARLAAEGEIEQLQQELTQATAELEGLRKSLGESQGEREKLRAEATEAAAQGAKKVLSVVRDTLPARVVHRIEAAAAGESVGRDLRMSPATIVTVRIKDIDQWAQSASPDALAERLDAFCQSIRVLAAANNGELAQVLGAAHLLTFGGDSDGIRNAVTCAREIASSVGGDIGGGIQLGVHAGAALSGFFGDETGASFLHLGEAVVVSRGASEFAPPGAVWVTETVRSALAGDGDVLFIATGPHLVRGFANPFNLFQVGTAG